MPQTSEEGKSKTSEGGESVVEKAWAAGLNFSCDSGGGSGSGRLQPLEPYKNEDVVRLWYPPLLPHGVPQFSHVVSL
jgi:hypothetical protein